MLQLDFLKLPPSTQGFQNVLVMVDAFTRYAWAVPTRDQFATTTAKVLWENVIRFFDCPKQMYADQGPNF